MPIELADIVVLRLWLEKDRRDLEERERALAILAEMLRERSDEMEWSDA